MLQLHVRKFHTFIDDTIAPGGDPGQMLRKVAAAAVITNPYAGRHVEDLQPLIGASADLGAELARIAVEAMGPRGVQSYGKAGIVGTAGEQEHANALLTTTFANPLRDAVGGGKAWISSMTKFGVPGCHIDVPLACKDALYVRSHYDGMTVVLAEAPLPDEVVIIVCIANRGRLNARVGGLPLDAVKGLDGLS